MSGFIRAPQEFWEVTHMCVEFSGVSEKIHGVIASHSLRYQRLVGKQRDKAIIYTDKDKEVKEFQVI